MRALVCDDHPLMREALASALRARWPGLALDEVGDYPAAWAIAETGVDVCLVDLGMPGAEPVEGLAALRAAAPGAVIVVVTGLTEDALLAQVRACGVAAVLSKNAEPTALIAAIGAALPGLRTVAPPLPPRQQAVLEFLAQGLTNKEIALKLGISPATVKIHVARVIAWLGASNRTDAVARAQRGRLV